METPSLDASPQSGGSGAPATAPKPERSESKKQAPPAQNAVKVGRVGVVQVASASIYRSKSSSSRRYSRVKAETPLAVVREEGDWYGVLMTNGSIGWIARKNVKMVGYELVAKQNEPARGSSTSRGGDVSRLGALANDLIKSAMQYSGVRYVFGGTNPATGMDCSAFVRKVFSQFGFKLPRTAREQALVGASVPFDQLQPGDRLYFACRNSYVDHCGIYTGNGYFVHCSSSRGGVGVDNLAKEFYWRSLVTARRS